MRTSKRQPDLARRSTHFEIAESVLEAEFSRTRRPHLRRESFRAFAMARNSKIMERSSEATAGLGRLNRAAVRLPRLKTAVAISPSKAMAINSFAIVISMSAATLAKTFDVRVQ